MQNKRTESNWKEVFEMILIPAVFLVGTLAITLASTLDSST